MIPVTKMHGARNDFIVLDQRSNKIDSLPKFARWVCDRRAGIGADGLIVIEAPEVADARMRIINADGSEAEMCGNGIRCAARWLDEVGEGDRIRFETLAGIVETWIVVREPEYLVRVALGTPHVASQPVRFMEDARFVDVGNPHVVIFRESVDDVDLTMIAGRLQSGNHGFPNGTNVHLAAVDGEDGLRVRHWERGVGLTMACGTGAVACAAAAIERGMLNSPVEVLTPGGRLTVEWDGAGQAFLTGPAVRVFETAVRVEAGAVV
ncbi:MAG TPA: diaminopimelate epimerase [Candidatus Baltobacteraceae bacterium]|nr:diaminopimelate epimerase [Candidatus Baltobacteraceae bacterium]